MIATRSPTQNGTSTIMDFEEEVKTHTQRVEAGERVRYGQACPHCGAVEGPFRMHDCRRRKFRLVVMYDDRTEAGLEKASGLAPSTVWRWLSWLGGMPGTLRTAWGLIREKEPNATLHRQGWVVTSSKYRSLKRQQMLQQAMQLLATDRVCENLFGEGIFPRFATGHAWR